MRELYASNPVNQPRMKTDIFFADYKNEYKYEGFMDSMIRYVEDFQLMNPTLWARFVNQFREEDANHDRGWRGEFWGKMMRGATLVYSYTKNSELYKILCDTVRDMMTTHRENEGGRISAFGLWHEFDGWDMWERKYVLLGMQYFLEICEDEELKAQVIKSMQIQVDCIMSKIGPASEGKIEITKATRNWRGLNSVSVLEPIVRLYSLTGEQKYFDFATYIVNTGATDIVNIFDRAYQDKLMPYQYPVTKAYEMTSCFEGLIEYYRINGNEKHKTAIINFAKRVLETDFTVIGSSGCTHELFDHSTVRQANTNNGKVAQETCVTVTLMKFFYQVYLMTGDVSYVDAFETSLYNAYMGAINTDKVVEPMILSDHPDWVAEPLPFDSYSPLTAGTRGNGIGGLRVMSDMHYYGCCACIGSAGFGLVPKMHLVASEDGMAMNLYINGEIQATTPAGAPITLTTETAYPKCGKVKITLALEAPESFTLRLRNPEWSKTTALTLNGEAAQVTDGYIAISREWKSGDCLELSLDMRCQAILPIPYGSQILMNHVVWGANYMIPTFDEEDPIAHRHIALRRGPVMLAQENRLGYSVDEPIEVEVGADGYVNVTFPESDKAPYAHILELEVPLTDGTKMTVTDYASAGKTFDEKSKMAVWFLTK